MGKFRGVVTMKDPVLGPPVCRPFVMIYGTVPDPMNIQKPDILYRNGVKRSPEERWQPLTDNE